MVARQAGKKTAAELETELKNVKAAFEEYISSSKELEEGLDKELTEMRKLKEERKKNDIRNIRYDVIISMKIEITYIFSIEFFFLPMIMHVPK